MNASYPYRRKKPRSGAHPGAPAGPGPRADTAPGPRSASWTSRGPGPVATQPHASALRVRNFRLLLSSVGEEALGLRLGVSLARLRELEQGLNFGDETAHHLEFMLGLRSGFIDLVNPQLTDADVERLKSSPENDFAEADASSDARAPTTTLAMQADPALSGASETFEARPVEAPDSRLMPGLPPVSVGLAETPRAADSGASPEGFSTSAGPVALSLPSRPAPTLFPSGSSPAMAKTLSRTASSQTSASSAPGAPKRRRTAASTAELPASAAEPSSAPAAASVKKRAARPAASVSPVPARVEPATKPATQPSAPPAPGTRVRKAPSTGPRSAAVAAASPESAAPAPARVTANLRALAPAARSTPAVVGAAGSAPPPAPSLASSPAPTAVTGSVAGSVRVAGKKTPATAAIGPVDDEELRRRELRRANLALVSSRPGGKSQLGRLAGMSPANISHRLHGNTALDMESAAFFCERLELPEGWLDEAHTEADVPEHVWRLLAQHAAAPAHANPARPKQTIEAKRRRLPDDTVRAPAEIPALAQDGPTRVLAAQVGGMLRSPASEPVREAVGATQAAGAALRLHESTVPARGLGEPGESLTATGPALAPIAEALLKTLALKARQGRLTEEQALKLLTEVSLM